MKPVLNTCKFCRDTYGEGESPKPPVVHSTRNVWKINGIVHCGCGAEASVSIPLRGTETGAEMLSIYETAEQIAALAWNSLNV